MMNGTIIREATRQDIPFLAEIILLAETSGKELMSYRSMFSLPDDELLKGFEIALDNEELGHGLTYKTFLIAEVDGIKGAAACGYIEGEYGNSNHLMTGALMTGFGMEEVMNAYQKNAEFKSTQIAKTVETLQIDSVATLPGFRGKGLFKLIFEAHCKAAIAKGCNMLEIQVWAGNEGALATYKKLGCSLTNEKYRDEYNKSKGGRIVMSKKLN